jgi:hypothetical protein
MRPGVFHPDMPLPSPATSPLHAVANVWRPWASAMAPCQGAKTLKPSIRVEADKE